MEEQNEQVAVSEGWDAGKQVAMGGTLKLKDGDSVKVIFLSPPVQMVGEFEGKKRMQNLFERVLVIGQPGEVRFYAGKPASSAIYGALEKVGDKFHNTVFTLTRVGTGRDTKYICVKDRDATDDDFGKAGDADVPF